MIAETTVPAHARGVGAVLDEAGLRSSVSVHRSGEGVNVLLQGVPADREDAYVGALLEALTGAGYEARRGLAMPWLVRVTGKRKNVRVPS